MMFALKKNNSNNKVIEIKIRGEIEDLTIKKKLEKKSKKKKKGNDSINIKNIWPFLV